MAAFVALDLGQTDESEREEEFVAGPPKSKKKRGTNAEYLYLEDAESLDDLKFKAKAAGLKMKSIGDGTAYYICKYAPCSYKWKANVTEDYKYVIKRTESDHDHAEHTQKKGLSKEAKKIIDKRIHDNERVNNNNIHPTGVAVISSETIAVYKWVFQFLKSNDYCEGVWEPSEVMADNSAAISAAVREVFPLAQRRSCKVHIDRAADDKLKELHIDKETGKKLKDQLCELKNHAFESHFDVAAAAIIAEWKASDDDRIIQFAEYFDRQYIQKNKFWFAANGQGVNHNNSLEATNKWIKVDFINRRLELMVAIGCLKQWLYKCVTKNYGNPEVKISDKQWIAAHDLKRTTKIIYCNDVWYVRRSSCARNERQWPNMSTLRTKLYDAERNRAGRGRRRGHTAALVID